VPDPLAAGALELEAGAEAADEVPAAADELDDELELHPPINAATTATATPLPATMRARSSLNMVLIAPLERKAHEPNLIFARLN
jgi:hypothetical protein